MNANRVKYIAIAFLKKWWGSLLLIPFIWYSLDQAYLALQFNIFFAISYNFPFPINIVYIFFDGFLLTVHEAGHTFFSIFGWRTLTILAGSLFQLFIPLLILAYCWLNRLVVGLQFALFLVGFSLIDVAFYIADASQRQLPLLGNLSKEAHDWHNLLLKWHMLDHDHAIAVSLSIISVAIFFTALILPCFYTKYKQVNLKLNI